MRKYFTTEDYYLMQKYGTDNREDTGERLKYAGVYAVDRGFKSLICDLRKTIADMTDEQWESFFIYYVKRTPLIILPDRTNTMEKAHEYE